MFPQLKRLFDEFKIKVALFARRNMLCLCKMWITICMFLAGSINLKYETNYIPGASVGPTEIILCWLRLVASSRIYITLCDVISGIIRQEYESFKLCNDLRLTDKSVSGTPVLCKSAPNQGRRRGAESSFRKRPPSKPENIQTIFKLNGDFSVLKPFLCSNWAELTNKSSGISGWKRGCRKISCQGGSGVVGVNMSSQSFLLSLLLLALSHISMAGRLIYKWFVADLILTLEIFQVWVGTTHPRGYWKGEGFKSSSSIICISMLFCKENTE